MIYNRGKNFKNGAVQPIGKKFIGFSAIRACVICATILKMNNLKRTMTKIVCVCGAAHGQIVHIKSMSCQIYFIIFDYLHCIITLKEIQLSILVNKQNLKCSMLLDLDQCCMHVFLFFLANDTHSYMYLSINDTIYYFIISAIVDK